MSCTNEMPPWYLELLITNSTVAYIWDRRWYPSTGVGTIDFTADVRNVTFDALGAMEIKPAIQLAALRTDRPDLGASIAAGSVITAGNTLTHYEETLNAPLRFWFRRGWSFKLTAGAFARAEVMLYTSFRSCGRMFPEREIVFQPTNDTNEYSSFPLTGVVAAVGVDVAKLGVFLLDNLNNKLEYRLIGRAFNDVRARGTWVLLPSAGAYEDTVAGDSADAVGEISLSGLSLTTNHYLELGLAVRKNATVDVNSRCILQVLSALKYT